MENPEAYVVPGDTNQVVRRPPSPHRQEHDVTETPRTTAPERATADATGSSAREATATTVAWLESEFPGWTFGVDQTATWEGSLRPLWIARRDGHHPQAEMSPSKLHTRLTDYLHREARRKAMSN